MLTEKRYAREREAALYVHKSPSWMQKARVIGGGPRYIKCGKNVIYDYADLDAWLESLKRSSTSETPARRVA